MRSFLATVIAGVLLGIGVGYSLGAFQASQMSWTPSLEVNKGVAIANAGKETNPSGDASGGKSGKRGKLPKVSVEETDFDFGIVEKNPSSEKGEHLFYITNVGDADMTLADGGKGCFCTEFTISKSILKPGEKATVKFMWDGARSGGVFSQGIRVLTNDPDNKEVMFAVRGLYTSPIVCDVGEITFPNASASQTMSRPFRIMGFEKNEDGSAFPLEIEDVEIADPEHFEVTLTRDTLDHLTEADRKSKLYMQTQNLFQGTVTLKPGLPQGPFQTQLRLRTNSPKTPIVDVFVSGQVSGSSVKVAGAFYDDKDTGILRLDNVPQSTGKKTSVRLTIFDKIHVDENTVKVKSVRPDWIKVELTYPPEELQKTSPIRLVGVDVEVPANSPQGAFMGPETERLGEIAISIGETEETSSDVVIPVRFAVVP